MASAFATNYENRPLATFVIMDDESITEKAGYISNKDMYEQFIRAGKVIKAHRLDVTLEELEQMEEEGYFETAYELDPTDSKAIYDKFVDDLERLQRSQAEQQRDQNTPKESVKNEAPKTDQGGANPEDSKG